MDENDVFNKKIPRIEYVLVIPESIEKNFNNILDLYKNNVTKSLKILKKSKYRISTENFIQSPQFSKILEEIICMIEYDDKSHNGQGLNEKELDFKNEVIDNFKLVLKDKNHNIKKEFGKKIIYYIEKMVEKYLKIIVHLDDQVFVITDKNKDNNKLFVKFFLPKIMVNNCDEEKFAIEEINTNKDNIHATILPTIDGHGLDGIFHLTFRIEGKNKTWFEYSKYLSLNRESNKFAFIVYDDETCSEYTIFKLTSEFDRLMDYLKSNKIDMIMDEFFESKIYKDLCEFIVYDIFNKLVHDQKIDMFLTRYFHIIGIKIINSIINKLLKIIFLSFIDLSYM